MIHLLELRHAQYSSGAGFTPANDASGEEASSLFKNAIDEYLRIGKRLLPYLDWEEPESDTLNNRDPVAYRQMYQQVFGVSIEQANERHEALKRMPVPEPPGGR